MYVQFDNAGNIQATVSGGAAPPDCANQIEVADGTSVIGQMVDTVNLVLIAAPVTPPVTPPTGA